MKGMLVYWPINHISLAGIDDLYWRERHGEVRNLGRLVQGIVSCSSIRRYFLRYLGIERQADGAPSIFSSL